MEKIGWRKVDSKLRTSAILQVKKLAKSGEINCSSQLNIPKIATKEAKMSAVCSECGKDDAIQKVTSILRGGTSSGTFSGPTGGATFVDGKLAPVGGYSRLSGTTRSQLAEILAPPKQPEAKVDAGLKILAICIWSFFIMMLLAYSCASSGYMSQSDQRGYLLTLGISLFFAVLVTWIISNLKKDAEEKLPSELDVWTKKMEVYNRLYYCHRDDVVFDPETGASVSPQKMNELLEH